MLRRLYPHVASAKLAELFGCGVTAIYRKAEKLGLRKSDDFLKSPAGGRLRPGSEVGLSGRFRPGHNTWNKGMKGLDIGGKATRFQPGHRGGKAAEIYKPIGTERVSKDGYLERKIHDGMPLQSRWRAVHLLVWEEANGPLPASHAIAFKDGNKRNTALDNLECISRAELMRRNTVHNLPPELKEVVQLKGAINRKITYMERRDEQHQ